MKAVKKGKVKAVKKGKVKAVKKDNAVKKGMQDNAVKKGMQDVNYVFRFYLFYGSVGHFHIQYVKTQHSRSSQLRCLFGVVVIGMSNHSASHPETDNMEG